MGVIIKVSLSLFLSLSLSPSLSLSLSRSLSLSLPFLPPSLPQRNNADVISESILNLKNEGLITAPEDWTHIHVTSELQQQGAPLPASSSDVDPVETTCTP